MFFENESDFIPLLRTIKKNLWVSGFPRWVGGNVKSIVLPV